MPDGKRRGGNNAVSTSPLHALNNVIVALLTRLDSISEPFLHAEYPLITHSSETVSANARYINNFR